MAKVSININGRKYALGCEDGEEERLMRLGQKLDDRVNNMACLLYTSPSPRDATLSRMPSSA